ncbi:MAG TPA: tRNA (adenosine(37)-N6)-dimethylallyltransferase MiaA [Clostridia bacterium]|jgi:tRNA dimethylallyltransferase|nr:tRNA (adenosine(37)-N6)-dimethylallyltransferase MiaA [Clostridia bacterium]
MINNVPLNNKLIIICGSTASGKTYIAEKFALEYGMEIISADSMQIYKDMDIGTAKAKNLKVKQHMIDIVKPNDEYNVFMYQKDVKSIINNTKNASEQYVVCGGTGLYIDSLYYKMNFGHGIEKENMELKNKLDDILEKHGKQYIYNLLMMSDPEAAKQLHPNNSRRVLRALYLVTLYEQPLSRIQTRKINDGIKLVILHTNRECLRQRVENRVEEMVKMGLVDEVKMLIEKYNLTFQNQSFQGIGYKEWESYLLGNADMESTKKLIITNTMQYAKRQTTWFNNRYKNNLIKIDTTSLYDDESEILKQISNFVLNTI